MRGNLTVLSIIGLFGVGAIWITVWAPKIPAQADLSSGVSWWDYPVPAAPTEGKGPIEIQHLAERLAEIKSLARRIKDKRSPYLADLAAKRKEFEAALAQARELEDDGKQLYGEFCAHCHGDAGKGDGFAAAFLEVPPRNLWQANFRFKTTPQGKMPRDTDLFRTISLGLRGTPMPGFARLLSEQQRWSLVQYLKTLSPKNKKWGDPKRYHSGAPIEAVLGPAPDGLDSPAMRKTAKKAYDANCASCHGENGYGDGDSSATQNDSSAGGKIPILPRNFHQPWAFKRGHSLRDIALTIAYGLDSVGMPEHGPPTPLKRDEIWGVAAHVMRFAEKLPRPRLGERPPRLAGRPDRELRIRARAWLYEQLVPAPKRGKGAERWVSLADQPIEVRQGALLRLVFEPADNGMGDGQGLAIAGYERTVHLTGVRTDRPAAVVFRADRAGTFRLYNPMQTAPGPRLARMSGTLKVDPAAARQGQ